MSTRSRSKLPPSTNQQAAADSRQTPAGSRRTRKRAIDDVDQETATGESSTQTKKRKLQQEPTRTDDEPEAMHLDSTGKEETIDSTDKDTSNDDQQDSMDEDDSTSQHQDHDSSYDNNDSSATKAVSGSSRVNEAQRRMIILDGRATNNLSSSLFRDDKSAVPARDRSLPEPTVDWPRQEVSASQSRRQTIIGQGVVDREMAYQYTNSRPRHKPDTLLTYARQPNVSTVDSRPHASPQPFSITHLLFTMSTIFVISLSIYLHAYPFIFKDLNVTSTVSENIHLDSPPKEELGQFEQKFQDLKTKFPSQTKRLWNIMGAATEAIFTEDEPTHPAVILLVGPRGNRSVIDCLAQRYAQAVTETFQHLTSDTQQPAIFDCEVEVHGDPSDTKRRLDQVFTGAFESGSRAGIVLHLESLAGQAAMIFYRFCDNDNAPFKKVVIILTLNLESDDAGNEKDNFAYNELRRVWKSSLNSDKIEPMLSRIGNSVAFIRPETGRILEDAGCSNSDEF